MPAIPALCERPGIGQAHADQQEILGWLEGFHQPPRTTFVTHGEPRAADALRVRIQEEFGWTVRVPELGEVARLAPRLP